VRHTWGEVKERYRKKGKKCWAEKWKNMERDRSEMGKERKEVSIPFFWKLQEVATLGIICIILLC